MRRHPFLFCATAIGAAMFMAVSLASASQSETAIYQFQPGTGDGYEPVAGVISDAAGNLYGTTLFGGSACGTVGCGTVFEVTPNEGGTWTESVLYSFLGSPDGAFPAGGLVFDKKGNLYGTTSGGGTSRGGIIFELSPPTQQGNPWTETVLYNFPSPNDGYFPVTLTIDNSGNLYGAEPGYPGSFGNVFEFSPPSGKRKSWTFTVLYQFLGGAQHDGTRPVGGLVYSVWGAIYGVTAAGGLGSGCNADGCGTVFQLAPQKNGSWKEKVLYMFTGESDGGVPVGLWLDRPIRTLYGATAIGGNSTSSGVVFELGPQKGGGWLESTLYSFGGADGLSMPQAGVITDAAGNVYGTTYLSTAGLGGVYELSPPQQSGGAWTETTQYQFTGGAGGGNGPSTLLLNGTQSSVYGTTEYGGQPSGGIVFELTLP